VGDGLGLGDGLGEGLGDGLGLGEGLGVGVGEIILQLRTISGVTFGVQGLIGGSGHSHPSLQLSTDQPVHVFTPLHL